jgi:hypothetical protein
MTGNINGCVLIAKNNKWQKYTDRALETIKYYNLPIKLYIVKPSEFSTTLLYDPNKPATRLLGGDRYGSHLATGNQLEFYYRVYIR